MFDNADFDTLNLRLILILRFQTVIQIVHRVVYTL